MFQDYFKSFSEIGILGKVFSNSRGDGITFELNIVSLPNYNKKGFKGVDDSPFGGGVGMIMRPDALESAFLKGIVEQGGYSDIKEELHVVCPAPRGMQWDHTRAQEFAEKRLSVNSQKDIVFICGRYEGIDERFLNQYVDEFISLGDYILTGGELATMVILDSALRFSDGVLGNKLSAQEESFANGNLEHALYTRPQDFNGEAIPSELLSGDPKKIDMFKKQSSSEMTKTYRPDLLK
jgi:tRNA (guanine37-N1)-methyltransferase